MLEGRVAIVTGAGRTDGMGWAAALALARAGATVVATGYGRAPLAASLNLGDITRFTEEERGEVQAADDLRHLGELLAAEQPGSWSAPLDVTSSEEVAALIGAVVDRLGRVDILFNNAGVAFGAGSFIDMTDDQWRCSLEVNVLGTVAMCRAALPHMIGERRGSIINNASIAGLRGEAGISGYAATKAAIISLTQSLAAEYGPYGVRVNAVCPGAIRTRMGEMEYAFKAAAGACTVDEAVDQVVAGIPLGRIGVPDEVADVVVFLAADASRYVTGTALPVTGGHI